MAVSLRPWTLCWLVCLTICGLAFSIPCPAESPISPNFPRYDWEPTIAPPGAQYVGSGACATCHVTESATQPSTPMGKALERPEDSEVLRKYPILTFQRGPYRYEIRRDGGTSSYSVSEGQRTIVTPILAAVGSGLGTVAQTYVLEYDGYFIESEVTYYDQIHGLDITLGHQATVPVSLEGALGIRLLWRDEWLCFGCHSTAAVSGYHLQLNRMIPGVGCEGCHGAGADHISAIKSSHFEDLHIFNPATLSPGDLNDFCGACHRTPLIEKMLGIRGAQNVRFQPYRLARSRCYDPSDPRISCLACHNPHQPLEQRAEAYDSKCLACHSSGLHEQSTASARATVSCPVAKQHCATCHMPKVEIPGAHFRFTDHFIRIPNQKAAYPE